MILSLRPSKTFLFEVLARALGRIRGGQGLDAAAAHMKNRWMFKTHTYVGLDNDATALQEGLRKAHGDPNVTAVTADLTKHLPLETGAFRAVVSTNTLSHLGVGRDAALMELIRVTSPDGTLICDLPIDDGSVEAMLRSAFRHVQVIYVKNSFSRAYEHLFEGENGWLGTHRIAGSRPFLLLSWLISRLEYLSSHLRLGNTHVMYICHGKK